ncbi:MAG TPA: YlxR family protein [Actinomycetota bacterium]
MAPTRTCVGCREPSSKSGLLRIVRSAEAGVQLDPDGTAPGRGAYVHRRAACLEAAGAEGVLARALRTGLGPDELGRLRDQMRTGVL